MSDADLWWMALSFLASGIAIGSVITHALCSARKR